MFPDKTALDKTSATFETTRYIYVYGLINNKWLGYRYDKALEIKREYSWHVLEVDNKEDLEEGLWKLILRYL